MAAAIGLAVAAVAIWGLIVFNSPWPYRVAMTFWLFFVLVAIARGLDKVRGTK